MPPHSIECRIAGFERRLELDPQDQISKANVAIELTKMKKHDEAVKIYKDVLASGLGTYDIMAYYGNSLFALGKLEEAEKWLSSALDLKPNLLDAIENLARVLVKQKRPVEAASLLESTMALYPGAGDYLRGDLISVQNTLEESTQVKSEVLQLSSLRGGHHFVPIRIGSERSSKLFLIDTGATYLSVPTELLRKSYPELIRRAEPVNLVTANGSMLKAKRLNLPRVRLADWNFTNVTAIFCDKCEPLVGSSLLNRLTLKISPEGGLAKMELRRKSFGR